MSPLAATRPNPSFLAIELAPPVEPIPSSSNSTNIAGNKISALAAAIHNKMMITVMNGLISGIN